VADYELGGPGEVGTVGPHGETLGPFVADDDGIVHVPDDMKNAVRALDAVGLKRHTPKPKPKRTKE
jgi:hypothetical protein